MTQLKPVTLKECPFCENANAGVMVGGDECYVKCLICGARGPSIQMMTENALDFALNAWNDRGRGVVAYTETRS